MTTRRLFAATAGAVILVGLWNLGWLGIVGGFTSGLLIGAWIATDLAADRTREQWARGYRQGRNEKETP